MGLDPELKLLMTEPVLIAPRVGVNSHGEPKYGADVEVYAYVYRLNTRVITDSGSEETTEVAAILDEPGLSVGLQDRLTLSNGRASYLMQVLSAKDELGEPYYLEVRA